MFMNLDNVINLGRNYTLEDFKRESLERRLEILTTLVNSIPRALLHQALVYRRVYTSGRELLEEFLRYLGIPLDEFMREKDFYKDYIPVDPRTYWDYVSTDKKGRGTMTRINLVTEVQITPKRVGYTLTSFGENIKGFVAYILKKYAEYEINPWELFGQTIEGEEKRIPICSIEMLRYIYEKKETSRNDMAKNFILTTPLSSLPIYLARFHKLGLIEYSSILSRRKETKKYRINRGKLEDLLKCLEDEECNKEISYRYYIGRNIARMIINYLIESNLTTITTKELLDLGVSYGNVYHIISWLIHKGVLSPEIPVRKKSIIRITEKGKKVYEDIIRPILEVAENPDKITEYEAELSNEDKWKLLEIYSGHKYFFGKRERIILSVLQNTNGLSLREIADKTKFNIGTICDILQKLKKKGIVKSDESDRWYIVDPRYKSL